MNGEGGGNKASIEQIRFNDEMKEKMAKMR